MASNSSDSEYTPELKPKGKNKAGIDTPESSKKRKRSSGACSPFQESSAAGNAYGNSDNEACSSSSKVPKLNKSGAPRKQREPRAKLMKWTDNDWKTAVIAIVHACGEANIPIPFDKAANVISEHVTGSAFQQAILKLKQKMSAEGHEIPSLKMSWTKKNQGTSTNPNAKPDPEPTPVKVKNHRPRALSMNDAETQSHLVCLKSIFLQGLNFESGVVIKHEDPEPESVGEHHHVPTLEHQPVPFVTQQAQFSAMEQVAEQMVDPFNVMEPMPVWYPYDSMNTSIYAPFHVLHPNNNGNYSAALNIPADDYFGDQFSIHASDGSNEEVQQGSTTQQGQGETEVFDNSNDDKENVVPTH